MSAATRAGWAAREKASASLIGKSMAALEMRSEVVLVSPALASAWLATRGAQRGISDEAVRAIAGDITRGAWEVTHQGIAFNRAGELIDGQHRLAAIVMADRSVSVMVTTGVAAEYASPIDRGRPRNIATIIGRSDGFVAVCNALHDLEHGAERHRATPSLVAEDYERHREGVDFAVAARTRVRGARFSAHIFSAYAYAYPTDPEKCAAFARGVETGADLSAGHPALTLRNFLERTRGARRDRELALGVLSVMRSFWKGIAHTTFYPGADAGKLYFDGQRRMRGLEAPEAPEKGDRS